MNNTSENEMMLLLRYNAVEDKTVLEKFLSIVKARQTFY